MPGRPDEQATEAPATNLAVAYTSTLALTLTNPATILAFVAIFAGLGLAASGSYAEASLVVLAVGLLDQIFSDSPITVNYAMMVLGVSGMIWVSGAWMEQARKE